MNHSIPDQQQRIDALNTARSFIVQAPAGSGKTTLLTQRYLKLLATVQEPEEIVAITFTRKAAAEMRNRVVEALNEATGHEPHNAHDRFTWNLAGEALKQNQARQWSLEENPNRLRIHTIDSLCSRLTRQMPALTLLGGGTQPTDDAALLYQRAARETLYDLESDAEWSDAIADVLIHLDNRFDRVEELLAGMLAKRDQWLRLIGFDDEPDQLRSLLEDNLRQLVEEALEQLCKFAPQGVIESLTEFARYSAHTLNEAGKKQPDWHPLLDLDHSLSPVADDLLYWRGLAELVFIKSKPQLRKKVNAVQGFPASNKTEQLGFQELLQNLQDEQQFLNALDTVRQLPNPCYSDMQWRLIQGLLPLLRVSVAHLNIIFAERGVVDHTEIALRALSALGSDEQPTDLSLMLDHRIQHILVDEFQDTSHTQYELLRRLTMGWEQDDGRTLFCVGDPMQSIYRFREADVGLYLMTKRTGIGDIRFEPLTLTVNFRSNANIVEWINTSFPKIFPQREDLQLGAVPYSKSDAIHDQQSDSRVEVHPIAQRDDAYEASVVANIIDETLHRYPQENIAILVRSRSHLAALLPVLRQQRIGFRITDGERLESLPVVQDIRSLTRALLHPADRLAWFSILRAPWCGITLADLYALTDGNLYQPLWALISDDAVCLSLSVDGQQRLSRFRDVIDTAFKRRGRQRLRQWIEGVWLALGGQHVTMNAQELLAAELVFDTIESLEEAGSISELQRLDEQLEALFAPPDPEASGQVEILTMHKAKGLEFDTVILPGLGRIPRNDVPGLLQWLRYKDSESNERLIMATIREASQSKELISDYIRQIESQKQTLESARLLYVATTRARRRLHLVGDVKFDSDGNPYPDNRSLLGQLWPAVQQAFDKLEKPEDEEHVDDNSTENPPPPLLRRVDTDWQPQFPTESLWRSSENEREPIEAVPEFEWASTTARHIGTVVHHYLEHIAIEGLSNWSIDRISDTHLEIQHHLKRLNVPDDEIEQSTKKIEQALLNVVNDEKARWILSDHEGAKCEFALTVREEDNLRRIVIDRTFIDETGKRWIIDYKSGSHGGGDLTAFLDSEEERYRDQLLSYGNAMQHLGDHPVHLALYFPLLKAWREIAFP